MKKTGSYLAGNLANIVTFLRIIFGVGMVLMVPFSFGFWVCYLCGGLSDLLDGSIARALNQQSEAGARLDSAADLVFGTALAVVVVANISLPAWLWGSIGVTAGIRLTGYAIGAYKYHTFSALHTWLNKITGISIFAFPVIYQVLGLQTGGLILVVAALASSVEEVILTVKAQELDRNCKSLFCQKRK